MNLYEAIKNNLKEGTLWGEYSDEDEKYGKLMYDYVEELIKNFKDFGWSYNDSSAKYGHYYFSKDGVDVEYCDNFDKLGVASIDSDFFVGKVIPSSIDKVNEGGLSDESYIMLDFQWSYPSAYSLASFVNTLVDNNSHESIKNNLNEGNYDKENTMYKDLKINELDNLITKSFKDVYVSFDWTVIANQMSVYCVFYGDVFNDLDYFIGTTFKKFCKKNGLDIKNGEVSVCFNADGDMDTDTEVVLSFDVSKGGNVFDVKVLDDFSESDNNSHEAIKKHGTDLDDYCIVAAAEFVSDSLPADWKSLSEDELKDLVYDGVYKYNNGNVEPEYEDFDFYGDLADPDKVYKYIVNNF